MMGLRGGRRFGKYRTSERQRHYAKEKYAKEQQDDSMAMKSRRERAWLWYVQHVGDPAWKEQQKKIYEEKMAEPGYMERQRKYRQNRYQKLKADPSLMEKHRESSRRYYQRTRERERERQQQEEHSPAKVPHT